MYTLMDILYQYAQEERMASLLNQTGSPFRPAWREAEAAQAALSEQLTGASAALFARYLDQREEAEYLERQALLRCGLSIGLELSRL